MLNDPSADYVTMLFVNVRSFLLVACHRTRTRCRSIVPLRFILVCDLSRASVL